MNEMKAPPLPEDNTPPPACDPEVPKPHKQVTQTEQGPSLDDCLKLLKGDRDEQHLAGLLLVTKFCKSDDQLSLRRVYDAVGPHFLDRLLKTGMGKGSSARSGGDNSDAYLQLSVTILATLCRAPEIACSEEMVNKIPLILEIITMCQGNESGSSVAEECYEFFFLVSSMSGNGLLALYNSGGLKVLASHISSLKDGSHAMEITIKLVQLIFTRISLDDINKTYSIELSIIVAATARQFAVLQTSMKFEALHLLTAILSSNYVAPIFSVPHVDPENSWSNYMRNGIVDILQNRVAPAERIQAIILAEYMVSKCGEGWLIGEVSIPNVQNCRTTNMCLLLVLEQSRVEIAVLLNDLAYLVYEAPKDTSPAAETILLKQRNVAVAYSLVEKIINLISNIDGHEGGIIDENTIMKMISQLNETARVVLEFLEDAKNHGRKRGDDLLASVRIIGSYLAEAPIACKEKVQELLGYMLSVEGEDEQSPFYSLCFLLPMLCQATLEVDGCQALVSSGGHRAVIECLKNLTGRNGSVIDDKGCLLACDTIMNILLKKEELQLVLDGSTCVDLLTTLVKWAENTHDLSRIMMASSICALVLDFTSEEALLSHTSFDASTLGSLSKLIATSIAFRKDGSVDYKDDDDLSEIVTEGYARWSQRYPHIRPR